MRLAFRAGREWLLFGNRASRRRSVWDATNVAPRPSETMIAGSCCRRTHGVQGVRSSNLGAPHHLDQRVTRYLIELYLLWGRILGYCQRGGGRVRVVLRIGRQLSTGRHPFKEFRGPNAWGNAASYRPSTLFSPRLFRSVNSAPHNQLR